MNIDILLSMDKWTNISINIPGGNIGDESPTERYINKKLNSK